MCGRFSIYTKKEVPEEHFGVEFQGQELAPHYNASPSQLLPIILSSSPEELGLSTWGLLPHWYKDGAKIRPMINARSESIYEKKMFADSFKKKTVLNTC